MIIDPEVRNRGPGFMRDGRIRSTIQFMRKAFDLNNTVEANDTFTNELLKKQCRFYERGLPQESRRRRPMNGHLKDQGVAHVLFLQA